VWSSLAQKMFYGNERPTHLAFANLTELFSRFSHVAPDLLEILQGILDKAEMFSKEVKNIIFHRSNDNFSGSSGDVYDPIDLERLADVVRRMGKDLPLKSRAESLAHAALEDNGRRYCLCRGPNDGGIMISCDSCDEWFHAECANIPSNECEKLKQYTCKACCDAQNIPYSYLHSPLNERSGSTNEEEKKRESSPEVEITDGDIWPLNYLRQFFFELEKLATKCDESEENMDRVGGERAPSNEEKESTKRKRAEEDEMTQNKRSKD